MASDIWLRTILIVRKETRCRHIGYSYRLTARVLLYAPSHRQDNTYYGLCYTSCGALAGTRNSSMGEVCEGRPLLTVYFQSMRSPIFTDYRLPPSGYVRKQSEIRPWWRCKPGDAALRVRGRWSLHLKNKKARRQKYYTSWHSNCSASSWDKIVFINVLAKFSTLLHAN